MAASGWDGRVSLRCGYCGFDDERELSLVQAAEPKTTAYRGDVRERAAPTRLPFALADALDGLTIQNATPDELWKAIERPILLDDARPTIEWKRVWLASWGALRLELLGDSLRARTMLEGALESVTAPAYRALLLCHLAQHAAAHSATELAETWLAAAPDVEIAELASERRAAQALVALAKGETDAALRRVGDEDVATDLVGAGRWLAVGIHLEARARSGRPSTALRDLTVRHGASAFSLVTTYCRAFGLATAETRAVSDEIVRRHVGRSLLSSAAWGAVPTLLAGTASGQPATAAIVAVIVGAAFAFLSWTATRPLSMRWPTASAVLRSLGFVAVVVAAGVVLWPGIRTHMASDPAPPSDPPRPSTSVPRTPSRGTMITGDRTRG